MHRFIMNPPHDKCVDHIDGNGLNNRRANLRICTLQENSCNKHGKRKFIGVYPYGKTGKYQGRIMKQGKSYHTRLFDDPLDAARARDALAIRLHGPFAHLNRPDEVGTAEVREQKSEVSEATNPPDRRPVEPAVGNCVVRMPIYPSPDRKPEPEHK
jgi:hypothetical protein